MEKSMILERDGYHLSRLAGQRIAEELMGQAISPTEHKKEDRRKIEISPHDAPPHNRKKRENNTGTKTNLWDMNKCN